MKRKIDLLGRVVIPKDVRNELGLEAGVEVDVGISGASVTIQKANRVCLLCGEKMNIVSIPDMQICDHCISVVKQQNPTAIA